jgi:dihydropyrimidinase
MVTRGRLSLEKFVSLTSEAPAKLYGLYPRKGTLAVDSDADVAIWDAKKTVRLTASIMHDRTGYTPYEGLSVTGWPEIVLSRGRVVVRDGTLQVAPGSGRFLPRQAGEAAQPLGTPAAEITGSMPSASPAPRRASVA